MLEKEVFIDWKEHPVTKQVFAHMEIQAREIAQYLLSVAGKDPVEDARLAGKAQAYLALLGITFEEVNSEE